MKTKTFFLIPLVFASVVTTPTIFAYAPPANHFFNTYEPFLNVEKNLFCLSQSASHCQRNTVKNREENCQKPGSEFQLSKDWCIPEQVNLLASTNKN